MIGSKAVTKPPGDARQVIVPSAFSTPSTGSRLATTTNDAVGGSLRVFGWGSVTSSFLGVHFDPSWLVPQCSTPRCVGPPCAEVAMSLGVCIREPIRPDGYRQGRDRRDSRRSCR